LQTSSGGFVKGPIPLPWLQTAARLPGKTLHVGLCLWYLAGLTRSTTVRLGTKAVHDMGISRDAKSDALRRLVEAGLVTVEQRPGKVPIVTLLTTSSSP
jgi:DNA-binding MarR family transcriptional regulator